MGGRGAEGVGVFFVLHLLSMAYPIFCTIASPLANFLLHNPECASFDFDDSVLGPTVPYADRVIVLENR